MQLFVEKVQQDFFDSLKPRWGPPKLAVSTGADAYGSRSVREYCRTTCLPSRVIACPGQELIQR